MTTQELKDWINVRIGKFFSYIDIRASFAKVIDELTATLLPTSAIKQTTGTSTTDVMSQKAVSDIFASTEKSNSELINVFTKGDFADITSWGATNSTITKNGSGVDVQLNVTTGIASYVRNFSAFIAKPNHKYAMLMDFYGINSEYIDFNVALRASNGSYVADGYTIEKVITGQRRISVCYFSIFESILVETNINLWLNASGNTHTENFHIKKIAFVDLGVLGSDYYNYSKESIVGLYESKGFDSTYVLSEFTRYSNMSTHSINSENLITLRGKKLVTIGDSITWQGKWQPYLSEYLGLDWSLIETQIGTSEIPPMGAGGTIVRPLFTNDISYSYPYASSPGTRRGASIHARSKFVHELNPDVIIVFGGQNDGALTGASLGSITDSAYVGDDLDYRVVSETGVTFYAAYKGLLQILSSTNPNARIFCVTTLRNWYYSPSDTYRDRYGVVTAISECAKLYGATVLDLYSECGINEYNAGISNDGTGSSQEIFYIKDSDDSSWISSGSARVHPNSNGALRIAQYMSNKMR